MGRVASIVTGVAALSALTVFLSLCARDNSQLLAVSRHETRVPAAPQPTQVVVAEKQPASDNITRVTVPELAPPADSPAQPAIVKSHTESSPVEKHASRRYVEFTLARSRRFQQVGTASVGVWKIDSNHKLYDMSVVAQGHRVDRKRVGLNSPITIPSSASERPLQLVVNSIDRNGISGYLSEPQSSR